jgi:multiple antibiotic resistance protein
MEKQLQAIVTILSLVNPLICGAMFAQIDSGQPRATQLADATKVMLAVLVILVIAALVGARVLQVFGISLEAFSIAGGGVLSWIGFNMMRGSSAQAPQPSGDGAGQRRSVTPVIMFAASPGTITGVITLAVAHARLRLPVTVLVAVAVAALVMWGVMALPRGGSGQRSGVLHDTGTQFMGLIVLAMGVQFGLTGFHDFLATQH